MAGPAKRSVSPFGTAPDREDDPLAAVAQAFEAAFGAPPAQKPKAVKTIAEAPFVPMFLRRAFDAPANDLPWLDSFCQYLVKLRPDFEEKGVAGAVAAGMNVVFEQKTELFLVDHHDKASCEKLGWADDHRDVVLFARERDTLVGRFFAPWTEREPGDFSAFVTRWAESLNPDRVLHFLDFCAGSKNPTFEHYLLFTHPALARWVSNKASVRSLFERVGPMLLKLKSPTWEADVRKSLGL